jgi:hypothetical protein
VRARSSLLVTLLAGALAASAAGAQIAVNPKGVDVNGQGATSVFLTFGPLGDYAPADAFWCGELIPAAPDIGERCDPATLFGALPARHDLARPSGQGALTDIMSIPPSVARRAYQAAASGAFATFFYVRRFVSASGAPDQYVFVICRLTGGGARVPLSLTDVTLAFDVEAPVVYVKPDEPPPALSARIAYTGTGRLRGRWEVVLPGEELPEERDLLPEAALPAEERGSQRRYTELERFNVFLPPTGRVTLRGPEPSRLPRSAEGTYHMLLRIEASDDKDADSNLDSLGVGPGIVHSGAVAGFPMPTLRYVVGTGGSELSPPRAGASLGLLLPAEGAVLAPATPMEFSWGGAPRAATYRLEVATVEGEVVLAAYVTRRPARYRAPPWLAERAAGRSLRWRVVALDARGSVLERSGWRHLSSAQPP